MIRTGKYYKDKYELVYFGKDDFQSVKNFVIEEQNKLNNKEYFSIDELDDVLNIFLSFGNATIGLTYKNEIYALLCIEITKINYLNLDFLNDKKSGWFGYSLVKEGYREKGFSSFLFKEIKKVIDENDVDYSFIAVHPNNEAVIKFYKNRGFIEYKILPLYGTTRLVLLKNEKEKI
ncbi:MAG: GNAT family N-acetyltransferase [Erysipelotrichaceae bacterium]|jgi:ribosomal protein S18 acetylase RimI-like enzyme|nr:GNAT family N-acetyltransferase [Erysipelotrichaceae bacterium]